MFKVEYGCNVENKFEQGSAECSDPLELLKARKAKANANKTKEKKNTASAAKKAPTESVGRNLMSIVVSKEPVSKPVVAAAEPPKPAPVALPVESTPDIGHQAERALDQGDFRKTQRGRGRGGFQTHREVDPETVSERVGFTDGPRTMTFRRGRGRYSATGGRRVRFDENAESPSEIGQLGGDSEEVSNRAPSGGRRRTGGFRRSTRDRPVEEEGVEPRESVVERPLRRRGRFSAHFEQSGRRQFDRHSGMVKSTVRGEDKRQGGGSHNWGRVTDVAEEAVVQDGAEESAVPNEPTFDEESAEVPEVDDEGKGEVSQEPMQMSLDEYREQQRKLKLQKNLEDVRRAGEGEDLSRFGKCSKAYHKKEFGSSKYTQQVQSDESSNESDATEEEEESPENVAAKLFVGKVYEEYRPHGERGRGGRGRGQPRGGGYRRQFDNQAGEYSGSRSGRGQFRNNQDFRGQQNEFGRRQADYAAPGADRHQQQQQQQVDMSDFPKLC